MSVLDRRIVQRGLAGGAQQIELVADNLLHHLDAGGIDVTGLTDIGILQHLAAFLIEGILDIAGDVDLVYTKLYGLSDLIIGVTGTTVKYKRNAYSSLDLFQSVKS